MAIGYRISTRSTADSTWRGKLSFTYEMDVLVDRSLPLGGRAPLAKLLEAAGLKAVDSGARGAIWERDPAVGKVELFVPHSGRARRQAQVTPIKQQPNLAGIALTDTELLHDHTTRLPIPVRRQDGTIDKLHVTVPSLGAFVTTKAATFFKRPPEAHDAGSHPKSAKDLLYIRDLVAAGPEIVKRIERDVEQIRQHSGAHAEVLQRSATQLDIALQPKANRIVLEAAAMQAERDSVSEQKARGDLIGHLLDAIEILRGAGG